MVQLSKQKEYIKTYFLKKKTKQMNEDSGTVFGVQSDINFYKGTENADFIFEI